MEDFKKTFKAINKETSQDPCLRKPYLEEITRLRDGRTVVSFFISFYAEAPLSQEDADMIEEVLLNIDNSKGVSLILDAPGGDGLAAERIIQICRSYSKGDFECIVPARAKSAATMVCLGADQIVMSLTSELGPIDPQVPYDVGFGPRWMAAHHIVKTYENLFNDAVKLEGGDIAPYLQQLSNFNAVYIEQLRTASELSKSIAISSLKNGMLLGEDDDSIRERIKPFTDPDFTMSHGRGITSDQAKDCGLKIVDVSPNDELWNAIWGLYMRSKYVVDNCRAKKLIETINDSYSS
ncbi:MAG TPA: hypothetical protein ENJ28_00955 [Gammaproteobacteria bacterium]|nr:hypothetical protein [Gammaproteobacteria bacterium]